MGALATVFWTAGLSGGWTAETGGAAGGGSGWATASMTGGINCVARHSSIWAKTQLAMLLVTASNTGGMNTCCDAKF